MYVPLNTVGWPDWYLGKSCFSYKTAWDVRFHDGMDDPISWSYPSNQTKWMHCGAGDVRDEHGNYCGVTDASVNQLTDEHLSLAEGAELGRLASYGVS